MCLYVYVYIYIYIYILRVPWEESGCRNRNDLTSPPLPTSPLSGEAEDGFVLSFFRGAGREDRRTDLGSFGGASLSFLHSFSIHLI